MIGTAFDDIDEEAADDGDEACPCESGYLFSECCGNKADSDEVEDAIVHILHRSPATSVLTDPQCLDIAHSVISLIWQGERLPMHGNPEPEGDEVTTAELYAAAARFLSECRYCANTGHFYGDPELGPCGCEPEEIDIEELIG